MAAGANRAERRVVLNLGTDRLVQVELDETGLAPPTPEIEQERRVAIHDLLEENSFRLVPREGRAIPAGPYSLRLITGDRHLILALTGPEDQPAAEIHLALSPFRAVMKDYFAICDSYFDAIRRRPPHQIEAIDMGRRGLHDEGSTLLQERLAGKAEIDFPTARQLFSLVCVLHHRG